MMEPIVKQVMERAAEEVWQTKRIRALEESHKDLEQRLHDQSLRIEKAKAILDEAERGEWHDPDQNCPMCAALEALEGK